MQVKKIIGWVLLLSGLLIIFWSLYSSYNIFTGRTLVPEIFKIEEQEKVQLEESKILTSQEEIQEEMTEMIGKQIKEIFPSEFSSRLLNLMSWSIFAGILVFGGSRMSGIGINLMRKG